MKYVLLLIILLAVRPGFSQVTENNAHDTTKTAINAALATTAVPQLQSQELNINVTPNPARDEITINYTLPRSRVVAVDIYNMAGQRVFSMNEGYRTAGPNTLYIRLDDRFAVGSYILKLTTVTSSEIYKFRKEK